MAVEPVRPEYDGACISNVVRALRGREPWVPDVIRDADSVVLLVIDGLGWNLIDTHREAMPTLAALEGGPITSVTPSTTTAALTSLTTGMAPVEHGVVGYRLCIDGEVLNVLRWSMPWGRPPPRPDAFQPRLAFGGEAIPVVTRADFASTGFSGLHLRGAALHGWHGVSSIAVHCRDLVGAGERFVYAYYGYADIVFHMHGLDDNFLVAELAFVDRLVQDVLESLPASTALAVTADHGHIRFEEWVDLDDDVQQLVGVQAGEARFRYLHARPGCVDDLLTATNERYADRAWVLSRDRLIDEGWLGPRTPTAEVARRIGDVVLAARDPIGFVDPANPGETRLRSGHGSLTPDEMLVPLLATRGAHP